MLKASNLHKCQGLIKVQTPPTVSNLKKSVVDTQNSTYSLSTALKTPHNSIMAVHHPYHVYVHQNYGSDVLSGMLNGMG